jgi:hypothetical protein
MIIDYSEFEKLEKQFQNLQDTDYNTAFTLRKKSASLMDYFGQIKATQDKLKAKNQLIAKGKEAEIKREYIEKYKVSRGREEVVVVNEDYFNSIEICGKLESLINYLGNIYYISQSVYERGNQKGGNYN